MAKKPDDGVKKSVLTEEPIFETKALVKRKVLFTSVDLAKSEPEEGMTLEKSITNILNATGDSVTRLAFEVDPHENHVYSSVYIRKIRLLPDELLKRISIQDDLVASIAQARSNHLSAFGRPRPDRYSLGFVFEPNVGVLDKLSKEQKEELDQRIHRAVTLLKNCGHTKGWSDAERCPFSKWLYESVRDAIIVGRIATEIIRVEDVASATNEKKFHSFRAIDAGTIYRAAPFRAQAESVRKAARTLLERVKNERLNPEKYLNDEYSWVQVIKNQPVQAFTSEECVTHTFYPVTDVELGGYPVTPIDTMLAAVTTHINITTMNKLYFQHGRAAKGMLLIQSDEVDEEVLERFKQQFNASVNAVDKSHRMPVFAVGTGDQISWQSIDGATNRDMEFQYLTDMNARVIFSAFMMSPEELPGWAYLSRGTNAQGMAEATTEYRLEGARDLGIRPIVAQFEDFINHAIVPLLDEEVAKHCRLRLMGLDAETAEKESIRLQQDMPLHMTYDQIVQKVEKQPIGKEMAGQFPLNQQYQAILDKYFTVGQIKAFFFGDQKALTDPQWGYVRDEFWLQWQQFQQQAQMAAQQAQAAAQAPQGDPNGPQDPSSGGGGVNSSGSQPAMDPKTAQQKSDQAKQAHGTDDLSQALDQAVDSLSKSEKDLPPHKRRLLAHHNKVVEQAMDGWKEECRQATKEILDVVEAHLPAKKK